MENENNTENAVSSFLNEVTEQKPDIFEKEDDVVTETEGTEETDVEEKPLPFHKDPKVQKYVEKQISKALEGIKPQNTDSNRGKEETYNLPESFVKLIGNDTEEKRQVLKDMSQYLESLPQKAKEQFLEEQRQEIERQETADREAEEELDNYFDAIEETYNVDLSSNSATAKKMRSDFIDYVRKIAPKDESGEITAYPDLVSAFEEFQDKSNKRPTNVRAKDLAARGLTRSGDATTATPSGRSWKDVDRFFDQLKKQN